MSEQRDQFDDKALESITMLTDCFDRIGNVLPDERVAVERAVFYAAAVLGMRPMEATLFLYEFVQHLLADRAMKESEQAAAPAPAPDSPYLGSGGEA